MNKIRNIPIATLILALVITIIQVSRPNGSYHDPFMDNMNVNSWEILYYQPWRVLTSPFLHHNYLHFLENLLFLLLFGWQVERKFGKGILLAVFFGSIVTSYVIWINLMHNWIIGISGGIYGLFGFSLVGNRRASWWTTLTKNPLHILFSANIILGVIIDIMEWVPFQTAYLAHIIGFLYGAAFAIVFEVIRTSISLKVIVVWLPLLFFASQLYSPWQIEWRLIRNEPLLLSESANCQLKSVDQEEFTPAEVKFVNASTKAKALYWLDYEGQAKFQFWLGPGGSKDYNSFIGHPWCIVDPGTYEAIQAIEITRPDQVVTIR